MATNGARSLIVAPPDTTERAKGEVATVANPTSRRLRSPAEPLSKFSPGAGNSGSETGKDAYYTTFLPR